MAVTYDVYVKERGRWFLECEFPWDEREEALDKAQALTKRRYVQAVKVIRERYDRITQMMTESTIFDTSGEAPAKASGDADGAASEGSGRSLAALDIWIDEDDEGAFVWEDADGDLGLRQSIASNPPSGAVRRLFAKIFAVACLSVGLATFTVPIFSGALLRIL